MTTEITVALLALFGTLFGSFSGIFVSNKFVNYRLEQLEKKVEIISTLAGQLAEVERDIKSAGRRLDELEEIVG